jgi:glycosyl hydrolase family 15
LACSFWLVDCLHMIGRCDEAAALFDRLLALRNDLGLLSEEYDPVAKRLVGNFPQAFSHVSLVNTACRLSGHDALAAPSTDNPPTRRLIDHHLPMLPSMARPKRRKRSRTSRHRRDAGH